VLLVALQARSRYPNRVMTRGPDRMDGVTERACGPAEGRRALTKENLYIP
jgi:hypothetical protein